MNVSEAVQARHSVRAFSDRPVTREHVESLLERARQAPSGGNLQPWHVYVLGGERLDEFKALMASKLQQQPTGEGSEYDVYPPRLKEPYRTRRFRCGAALYESLGIAHEDKLARLRQFANNYGFFGAPVGLFFAIDRTMQEGQWSDLGMFIQTLMLLAVEEGLATCPQEAWAIWHRTVADFVDLPDHLMLFCGMALGYADRDHPVNGWRTERAPLDEFVEWHGI